MCTCPSESITAVTPTPAETAFAPVSPSTAL
eukprot:CAMPEP_0170137692 /NCGR_PEP_ID=MMETSP0033_2-20121228/4355_1 /TAXON_ID=195969 /ORGANISM="Dolichomastix tenuilepis, Strain CCMP3274" /LENGTH=30 /DNA_ID= /DNA_START= /DNA_END= /DNA_ORIENTATION=